MNSNYDFTSKEQLTYFLRIILDIAWQDVKNLEKNKIEIAYKKRLKFNNITDWKKYKASIDLLDDTEYAILSAFQYQLGDLKNKNLDIGETNIRLYGILNAVYLQMSAYVELSNLLNLPVRKDVYPNFCNLKIYHLRNMVASHTINYKNNKDSIKIELGGNKKHSFRIIQSELGKNGNTIRVLNENDISITYNLKETLTEYESMARKLLIQLINHSIEKLVNKKEDKIEIRKRLKETLSQLIDYSKIDENEKYWSILKRKQMKKLASYEKLTNKEMLSALDDFIPFNK